MAVSAFDVAQTASKAGSGGFQVFGVTELEGSAPITVELRDGLMVERGAEWASELRGSGYTPIGADRGFSTVTGVTWGTSELTLSWDAAFMKPSQIKAANAPAVGSPEDLLALFVTLQRRGRECLVQVAGFTRRGVLRKVSGRPGRGYQVDVTTGQLGAAAGTNLGVVLSWEWTGDGSSFVPARALQTPPQIAGSLGGASAALGAALAKGDLLDPSLLDSLRGGIGRMREGMSSLRTSLRKVGDLARAPAALVNETLAAARSLGNVVNDFDSLLHDTADDYLAAGKGVTALAAAKGVVGSMASASHDAAGAVVAVFDAFASRKPKVIGVRPGASLADVARAELGSADRWPEIAALNEIQGQIVPLGTFEVELPARGQ
jgi:hypothetical protein